MRYVGLNSHGREGDSENQKEIEERDKHETNTRIGVFGPSRRRRGRREGRQGEENDERRERKSLLIRGRE
eukprot:1352684-Amorphochlora_amoeboformis.AAC.1